MNRVPFHHSIRHHLLVLASLSFLLIQYGCASQANEKKPAQIGAAASIHIPVDGHIARPVSLNEELEVTGSLVANQEVSIVSELTRKIVRVQVKEGNLVQAGALLFQLDDDDLQAQLERLRQQEKLAVLNENRLKDLIEHDAAAQQDYDQAITNLKVLQAQIRELQVTIGKTSIRAPFTGRIGIVSVYPGTLVSPSTVLTSIVDDNRMKLEFRVPEKYAALINPGNQQAFTVASDTAKYTATVIARESGLNDQTRTLLVRAISPNANHHLLPGQSARLHLALRTTAGALTVPSQALMPSSQGYSIFISRNNKAVPASVETGQRGPFDVEIIKGLSAGDTVIVSNLLRLTPGAEVDWVSLK